MASSQENAHEVFSLFKDLCEQNPNTDLEEFLAHHSEVAAEVRQMLLDEESVVRHLQAIRPEFPIWRTEPSVLSEGHTIGEYDLKEILGRGGMGIVFRAQHRDQSRDVAIKRIRGAAGTKGEVERFKIEQTFLERLEHPRIVKLFDHGVDQGQPFFVMQLMKGGSLGSHARETALQEIRRLVPAIEAVGFAHERGIIHCDLKPQNILFDDAGNAFISDFGLARDVKKTQGLKSSPGAGTFQFIAPERHREDHIPTVRSDIYSLGAVLLDRVTPSPKFGQSGDHILLELTEQNRQRLEQVRCLDLRAILSRCLSRVPDDRYSDCGELLSDLNRWLTGDTVAARVPPTPERIFRWYRRNRLSFFLLLSTVVALVLGVTASVGFMVSLQKSSEQNRLLAQRAESLAELSEKQAEQAKLSERKAISQVRRIQDQFKLLSSLFSGLNAEVDSLDGTQLREKVTQNLRNAVRTLSQLSSEISPDEIELAVASAGILHDIGFQKEATRLLQEVHAKAQAEFGSDSITAILLELELARARMYQEDDHARVSRIERLSKEVSNRLDETDRRRLRAEIILAESWLGLPEKCESSRSLFASIASNALNASTDCSDMRETALHGIGAALHGQRRLPEAVEALTAALQFTLALHGPRHVSRMRLEHHLGNVCRDMKDFKASCSHLETAYGLGCELLGRENGETAVSLNMLLTSCAEGKEDVVLAKRLLELLPDAYESSKVMFRILGEDHPVAIEMSGNVATAADAAAQFDLCVEIRRDLLRRIENTKGPDSLDALRCSRDLAFALLKSSEVDEATERLQQFVQSAGKFTEITSSEVEEAKTKLSALESTVR